MPNIFSPESIPTADKLLQIVRDNPSGVDGDPALEALHWGSLIETIINIDPADLDAFPQFADQDEARVEFQLIGILVPYLLDFAPERRGDIAHYLLDHLDDEQYTRIMKEVKKKESSNK